MTRSVEEFLGSIAIRRRSTQAISSSTNLSFTWASSEAAEEFRIFRGDLFSNICPCPTHSGDHLGHGRRAAEEATNQGQ